MAQDAEKQMPKYMKYVLGGSAGMMGAFFIHPLDLLKNRMQLSGMGTKAKEYQSSFHAVKNILKREGALAFYNGLSAGLLRQATYTTARLGTYTYLFEKYRSPDGTPPGFIMKVSMAILAGFSGALVGCPPGIALVRMTADGRLPPAERRNYNHAFDALIRMAKEEGVLTLWRGIIPGIGRAVVVNVTQLATYSQAKQFLLSTGYFGDNIGVHFGSAMISGLATTTASLPIDIAKTRIQYMKIVGGKPEYTGMIDVFRKVVRNEGPLSLWKGFTPYYARLGSHTVLMLIFLEQLTSAYNTYVLGLKGKAGSM